MRRGHAYPPGGYPMLPAVVSASPCGRNGGGRFMSDDVDVEAGGEGLSRDELLRRAAASGLVLAGAGGLAGIAEAALAAKPKRGGTVRAGGAGGGPEGLLQWG